MLRSYFRRLAVCALLAGSICLAGPDSKPAVEANEKVEQALSGAKVTVVECFVLGVVEGLTEYLPVSSTGHLILAAWLLGIDQESPGVKAFEIVIQLGAILAVLTLYKVPVSRMIAGGFGRDRQGLLLGLKLLLAFVPAAVVGLALEDVIDRWLFSEWWVAFFLAVGGVGMIGAELWYRRCHRALRGTKGVELAEGGVTWLQAFGIGCFQCLALCPGMSRSMVTIVGGIVLGLGMVRSAEFSFLLALPTLGAATVYKLLSTWNGLIEGVGVVGIAVGLLVSYVVAMLSVKLLVRWLTRYGLTPFGVYRLLAAGLVASLLAGVLS